MCVSIIYVCICLYCVICLILYYQSLLICTNKEFMNAMKLLCFCQLQYEVIDIVWYSNYETHNFVNNLTISKGTKSLEYLSIINLFYELPKCYNSRNSGYQKWVLCVLDNAKM